MMCLPGKNDQKNYHEDVAAACIEEVPSWSCSLREDLEKGNDSRRQL